MTGYALQMAGIHQPNELNSVAMHKFLHACKIQATHYICWSVSSTSLACKVIHLSRSLHLLVSVKCKLVTCSHPTVTYLSMSAPIQVNVHGRQVPLASLFVLMQAWSV